MRSEQEKEEEKGMPIIVVKDNETKVLMAKVVPSKAVNEYTVEVVRRFVEQFGYNRGDLEERQRAGDLGVEGGSEERDERGDCHGGGTCRRSSSKWRRGECGEERAVSVQGAAERAEKRFQ